MYIIAGLGNPGREYENTRHNVGFCVLEKLAAEENISVLEKRHRAIIGKGMVSGQKCILAKPQTYMNLSGESIRELVNFYKVDEEAELIVISDDISLEPGQIRIRKKGSAGGHNGLKNIIAVLGHDTFIRVKMGVGEKPAGWDLADYVLGRFSAKDRESVDEAAGRAADAIRMIIAEGPDAAMNRYNASPKGGSVPKKEKKSVQGGRGAESAEVHKGECREPEVSVPQGGESRAVGSAEVHKGESRKPEAGVPQGGESRAVGSAEVHKGESRKPEAGVPQGGESRAVESAEVHKGERREPEVSVPQGGESRNVEGRRI